MSSDTRVSLSSVAEIVSTKVPVSSLAGHQYVSTENLLPNLGGLGEGELPDAERVNSFKKSDTLFSNIRPYFRKLYYAPIGGGCSADVLVFRTKDPQEFWPPYLYYCLADPTFIDHTMATSKGAKMPRGDKGAMLQYQVFKPDLETQKKVSSLLRSLDESILTLQHQNTTLEAIAQRLFRSWFVNFDPVHAKVAGQQPEAMSAELAALFPSEFEESALGLIPKGWLAGSLQDVSLLNPETWSGRNHPAEVTYLDLSGIKKNSIPEVIKYNYDEAPSRARRVLKKGDSLYGTVRPGNLSYGYIGEDEAGLTGSTGFAVLRPKHARDSEYVYCAMTLKESIERLVLLADGAAYPAVRPEIVHGQETVLADEKVMAAFHRSTKPLFQQITINKSTIKCLCELRDHLLPRLISGKLSLSDAEVALASVKPEVERA